jgi:uncharacterized iron-regulated membrane protein
MKKIFRKIHLWLSVPFGLIITLVCFSGAMLVFENEANEWFRRDLYYVETVKESPLPMDKLLEKVATTLPDSVSVTGVSISSDPGRAYQVSLSKPRRASLYVDQYTGEVKGKSERSGFFMFMFRMHRWLLDSMNPGNEGIFWGKMIVGVSTLLLVFVLISGIVIWWPRTRKALKNSLKITATKGWRRFWYDLHVAGGMYALIFLLAMALTGLTWSFPWYRTAFYKVFGVEVQQRAAQGHEQVNPVSAKASRKIRAYIPPATCKSYQNLLQPFVAVIFRLFFNALRVRGHQMTIPEISTKTSKSVLTPTIILPQKIPSFPGFILSRSQRCIRNINIKKPLRSLFPFTSPVYWSTYKDARRGLERLT